MGNGNSEQYPSENGNSGQCPFGKVGIRDNIPLEKWRFWTMSLSGNRNSGQFSFGKVEIRDNVPSEKDLFGKMGFRIFGKLGFVKLGFGIISLREIRYFGQMFHSGNLLFGIMASGKDTFGKCGFGKSSDIAHKPLQKKNNHPK